jgi:tellurite methyltransferase
MLDKLTEWDAKYRDALEHAPAEPSNIVVELRPLLPRGNVLDIACGAGRHTLILATQQGYQVTAVDASAAALDILEKRARGAGIEVRRETDLGKRSQHAAPRLRLVQADLEATELPPDSFDAILCTHYLQRSLFSPMERALRAGGMLLFETYTRAQLSFDSVFASLPAQAGANPETRFAGGPHNPEFLLERHELRHAFPGLRTIFYRELCAGKGIASLLAQRPS